MIEFGPDICRDLDTATGREWLETNGIGGFASGTISGINTRRYHGLLIAAIEPPTGRFRMVSKFLELVKIGDEAIELSSSRFPGTVQPKGYQLLTRFRLDPFPVWTYKLGEIEIEKKVFMPHGHNAAVVGYELRNKPRKDIPPIQIELRPLIACVDYHGIQHVDQSLDASFEYTNGVASTRPYSQLSPVYFHTGEAAIEETGYWYMDFEYEIEKERGFDFQEDLFQPFVMRFDLQSRVDVIITTDDQFAGDAKTFERSEIRRRKALLKKAKPIDESERILIAAADQFIVERGSGHTIIAGYPWFSDWGRDSMISLNGLTLATNRYDIAREIILEFAEHISEGMIPNRFPDRGETPEYNTVDATLWYFEAIRAYAEASGDIETVRDQFYEKLAVVVAAHLKGTRFNIHVDTDGLLYAGEPGVQLTWMDAKVGDKVITPRTGKAVEIQALWYNALKIMEDLATRFGHDKDAVRFKSMAELTRLSFNASFWNSDAGCLYDVISDGERDGSIRPNQILAASLHYTMLDDERVRLVVEKVESDLLTPYGLRSLSPSDPSYIKMYSGSPVERDSAYHQGTVWAWLIGPFIDAYRKAFPERTEKVTTFLAAFDEHLLAAGIGQVSEIFDAEPPYLPRGCPAQAWSVAELLRITRSINR